MPKVIIRSREEIEEIYAQAMKCAKDRDYSKMIELLEKMPPRDCDKFDEEFAKYERENDLDVITDIRETVTIEEWKRWEWLGSSEREAQYLLAIPSKDKTAQDWADLKAVAF